MTDTSIFYYQLFDVLMSNLPDPASPHWTVERKRLWLSAFIALLDVYIEVIPEPQPLPQPPQQSEVERLNNIVGAQRLILETKP